MNFQQQKQQAKYRYAAQVRQNNLAKENAIQRAAAESTRERGAGIESAVAVNPDRCLFLTRQVACQAYRPVLDRGEHDVA